MKLIVASILLTVAVADRLEKTYLPPGSAGGAGGSGSFLRPPSGSGGSKFGGSSFGSKFGTSGFGSKYGSSSSGGGGHSQSFSSFGSSGGNRGGAGAPGPDAGAAVLKFNNENSGDGSYRFEFETSNKISQQESGELKNSGTDQESSAVYGSYSYIGLDGQSYVVNYVADENGFRPVGDHLPTPPPIPDEIQKSLSQHSSGGDGSYNEGSYSSNSNQGSYSSGSNQGSYSSGGGGGFKQNSFSSGFQNKGGFSGNSFNSGSQPSRQYLTPKQGY